MPPLQKLLSDARAISKVDTIDMELLLAHILRKPREFVLACPEYVLTQGESEQFRTMLRDRSKGMPLAYITGEKEFYGHAFTVNRHTLIPRPETELLVAHALKSLFPHCESDRSNEQMWQALNSGIPAPRHQNDTSHNKRSYGTLLIDIGTGSGCILISIAKQLKEALSKKQAIQLIAIDISKDALATAKKNAKKHNVEKYIQFIHSNLLEKILASPSIIEHQTSIILLANLPYVPTPYLQKEKTDLTKGLSYEPALALDGGEDGLDLYRVLLDQTKILQKKYPDSSIHSLYEIDSMQRDSLTREICKHFPCARPNFTQDLSSHWRLADFSL